jgi:ABC-2 type transport system ATP-binding protein
MPTASPVLEVKSLKKSYGDILAVDNISFVVRVNEIVGLLGPNGAGKTTTINMILGILAPTDGPIWIEGKDVAVKCSEALAETNFAAVYAQVPGNLTVYQNLYKFGNEMIHAPPQIGNTVDQSEDDFYIVLAYAIFATIFRGAVRTGLIARYSAENVS